MSHLAEARRLAEVGSRETVTIAMAQLHASIAVAESLERIAARLEHVTDDDSGGMVRAEVISR